MCANPAFWTINQGGNNPVHTATSGGDVSPIYGMLRIGGAARVLGVSTFMDTFLTALGPHPGGGVSADLAAIIRYSFRDNSGALVTSPAQPPIITMNTISNGGVSGWRRRFNFMPFVHLPVAGPVVLANAAGVGAPIWASGRRAPRPTPFFTNGEFEGVGIAIKASSAGGFGGAGFSVGPMTFWTSKGL